MGLLSDDIFYWSLYLSGQKQIILGIFRNTAGMLIYISIVLLWACLVAQRLKHLPAMQETWVRSLGREDPLEKEMATHSSILAWRIPWTEEPGGVKKSWTRLSDFTFAFTFIVLLRENILIYNF